MFARTTPGRIECRDPLCPLRSAEEVRILWLAHAPDVVWLGAIAVSMLLEDKGPRDHPQLGEYLRHAHTVGGSRAVNGWAIPTAISHFPPCPSHYCQAAPSCPNSHAMRAPHQAHHPCMSVNPDGSQGVPCQLLCRRRGPSPKIRCP